MIKRIKFAGIPVHDQQRALDFYTGKLGFKVHTDAPYRDGLRWIELEIPGAETRLTFDSPRKEESSTPAMVFAADDVEKTYEELKSQGVEFTQPPQRAPWGMFALFKDSEGNLILLSASES
jgi:predicted enzyme related to lactoylglutathione lyase